MAATAEASLQKRHTTLIVVAVTIATATVAYNTSAVITAMPAIKVDFDMRPTALQWVLSLYMLSSAVLVAAMGRFADIFGHLRIAMLGMCLFVLGSLSIIAAPDPALVYVGRALQGIAAAAIFSTALAILNKAVPEEKRAASIGIWGAAAAFGLSIGPVIGGLLTEFIDWRGVFALDLLTMGTGLAIASRMSRAGGLAEQRQSQTIDYRGLVLLILCLGPLAYALTHCAEAGFGLHILILFVVAIVAGVLFFVVERRAENPLIHLGFFHKSHYCAATLGMFITGAFMFLFQYIYNLYVQSPETLAYSATTAGLSLLPYTMTMFVFAVVAPRALAKFSFRWPVTIGLVSAVIAFAVLHFVSTQTDYAQIWWKLLIFGVAMGLTFPLLPRVGLRVLPDEHSGQGSGVINTCLYFGGTMGIVIGGLVSSISLQSSLKPVVASLKLGAEEQQQTLHNLVHGTASQVKDTVSHAVAKGAANLGQEVQAAIDTSYSDVMLAGLIVSLIGVVGFSWFMRGSAPQ